MYYQECALYGFQQHILTNEQYYEQFNSNFDVGLAISITRKHHFLMEDMAQEKFKRKFDDLIPDEQLIKIIFAKRLYYRGRPVSQ